MSSSKQSLEIKLSVLEYLYRNGYHDSYLMFRLESELSLDEAPEENDPLLSNPKLNGLLEKKWVTVLRLQKRLIDLESSIKNQTNNNDNNDINNLPILIPQNKSIATLSGHRGSINRLSFHPTYPIVCSGSDDFMIKVWDYETFEFERTLKGHTKIVHGLNFNSKGNLLASCSSDLSIKLWDVMNDYTCIKTLMGHDHTVSSVNFSPSGDHLISASRDKSIKVWDTLSGYCIKTITGHLDWVKWVQPSLDGKLVISSSTDQTARIFDLQTGECKSELRNHTNVVEMAMFLPNNTYNCLKELLDIKIDMQVSNQFIVTACRDKLIRLFDNQGQLLFTFKGHDNWVRELTVTPSGHHLISSSDDKTCKVWDLKTGRACRTLQGHDHFISCLALNPNGQILITGSVDLNLMVWKCS